MSGVKCPKCDREFWAVYRKRTKTEYRLVDTISSQVKTGHKKYKGNWKTEETKGGSGLPARNNYRG